MAQDGPKMTQDAPEMAQDAPKIAKDNPKMAQDTKMSVSPRREHNSQHPNLENEVFASAKTPFNINLSKHGNGKRAKVENIFRILKPKAPQHMKSSVSFRRDGPRCPQDGPR